MSSSFGTVFRVTTFGESHGKSVGCVIDGCPPRMPLTESDIQPQLDRRRPGQSRLSTPRSESDRVAILSGVEDGRTLGTPIALTVPNRDARPKDYAVGARAPRPSHADFTYAEKYGIQASSGGGRASARETVGRVAAGAVAEKLLRLSFDVRMVAWVSAVGDVTASDFQDAPPSRSDVDAHPVRAPDPESAERMSRAIEEARDRNDSIGGMVTCVCEGLPAGWGEPVFDKLPAMLAHAMMSIPAAKGFDIGSGFDGTRCLGSQHNDVFMPGAAGIVPRTNRSGGTQGGISNGRPVYFRVAFKPVATIGLPQATVDWEGNPVTLELEGRHDPCVVPRAVPIVESMAALVLADAALRQTARAAFPFCGDSDVNELGHLRGGCRAKRRG